MFRSPLTLRALLVNGGATSLGLRLAVHEKTRARRVRVCGVLEGGSRLWWTLRPQNHRRSRTDIMTRLLYSSVTERRETSNVSSP